MAIPTKAELEKKPAAWQMHPESLYPHGAGKLRERLTQKDIDRFLGSLSDAEVRQIVYDWHFWARPEQIVPFDEDWVIMLLIGGRFGGKTRTGAEAVREAVNLHGHRELCLAGRTHTEARQVMVEGPSGILEVCRGDKHNEVVPYKNELRWANGARALLRSGDKPDGARGGNFSFVWADEMASWRDMDKPENTWTLIRAATRNPWPPRRIVVTTTPKRTKTLQRLWDAALDPGNLRTRMRVMTSFANYANVDRNVYQDEVIPLLNTRYGRQEFLGELLQDVEGAVWTQDDVNNCHLDVESEEWPKDFDIITISVDPAMKNNDDSDDTAIVVGGEHNGKVYILYAASGRWSAREWIGRVWSLYKEYQAAYVLYEDNQGGDAVREAMLEGGKEQMQLKSVHASASKRARAETAQLKYAQGMVKHASYGSGGISAGMAHLESQMTGFTGERGDEDGLVDSLSHLVRDRIVLGQDFIGFGPDF